jgi:murein DD-endopeptidase
MMPRCPMVLRLAIIFIFISSADLVIPGFVAQDKHPAQTKSQPDCSPLISKLKEKVPQLSFLMNPASSFAQTVFEQAAPVEISASITPIPVRAGGKNILAYELHLTNFGQRELSLLRLEIRSDARESAPLAVYEGDSLANLMEPLALYGKPPDKRRIGMGVRTVVYIWLKLDAGKPLPAILKHHLTFTPKASDEKTVPTEQFSQVTVSVSEDKPVVIGPPLRGEIWLAGNGPGHAHNGHRMGMVVVDGVARVSSRFAIDWVQYGKNDKPFRVDEYKNADYYAYDAELLAVADGIVSSIKDGIPENVPGWNSRAVTIMSETIGGNYVILNLGRGRYAVYAHVKPGSIRVKPGHRVRKGQVLALLGNSGNSDAPHLHFHICNTNSVSGCEGLPFLFENFELIGRDGRALPNNRKEEHRNEMPLLNDVINFPDAKR